MSNESISRESGADKIMKPTITFVEIMKKNIEKKIGFVDVRSSGEYHESTIPGAVNIPVLDNEARAKVGTLYVEGNVEDAKQYGVTSISERLPEMYGQYRKLL